MPLLPPPFSNQPLSDWIAQLQQSASAEDRVRALQAIGVLGSPLEVVAWALNAVRDTDSTVRALAAKQLGAIEASEAVETQLVSLLDDVDPDVKFEAARALVRAKSQQSILTVPVFLTFLDETETHPLMVAAVVNTLVKIDLPPQTTMEGLRPRLQRLLNHERAAVREAVSSAFVKWPAMGASCVDQLLPLLDDNEPVVRENIAKSLGESGVTNDAIRAALQTASQDEDVEVARAANDALQRLDAR